MHHYNNPVYKLHSLLRVHCNHQAHVYLYIHTYNAPALPRQRTPARKRQAPAAHRHSQYHLMKRISMLPLRQSTRPPPYRLGGGLTLMLPWTKCSMSSQSIRCRQTPRPSRLGCQLRSACRVSIARISYMVVLSRVPPLHISHCNVSCIPSTLHAPYD